MIDRDSLEKALLVNIVRNKKWDILITNNINVNYFSYANREMYNYILDYTKKHEYPDLQIVCYKFNIDEVSLQDYIQITDLQGLCNELINEYIRETLVYELKGLNEHNNDIVKDPTKFIQEFGNSYNKLKLLAFKDKTVDLFNDIEEILQIDPNNVISTGFKELDEKLTGWKRGEDLIVFMARTGQGKSWFGLKFALSAAMNGERVGIYSGEMSVKQLQERIICCGKQEYTTTSEDAAKFLKEQDLCIKVLTPKELRRRANVTDLEEMIVREKLTMLVVDQLSLMEDIQTDYKVPLRQQYGNITNDLFDLTQRYNLPIILLVQSNRSGANNINGPELENISESDAVAQNATRVISMKNENGELTLRIVKNRYGISEGVIKYEVDYGINKYKPIQEQSMQISALKQAKARSLFDRSPF